MKIAWIYPVDKRCGISFYSDAYVRALKPLVEVVPIDTDALKTDTEGCISRINGCDAVHVQYETSFFIDGRRDWYNAVVSRITKPIVVSLHEVYEKFPGVFSRDRIQGSGILRMLREVVYDWRHPYVTAFSRHLAGSFCARRIFVHHPFQRQILMDKGISRERLCVLPHPVTDRFAAGSDPWQDGSVIQLCATGFINPTYDYALLMATLERLPMPWRFTWIGGLRNREHGSILDWINKTILERNWQSRFYVTGWVDDAERDRALNESHVYLALYKQRSSSESLANAIGARCAIVATSIPMVNDIVSMFPVATAVERTPAIIVRAVEQYAADADFRARRREACRQYVQAYGIDVMAERLVSEYEGVVSALK